MVKKKVRKKVVRTVSKKRLSKEERILRDLKRLVRTWERIPERRIEAEDSRDAYKYAGWDIEELIKKYEK